MTNHASILVLGSSGWLGHYLVPQLLKGNPSAAVIAGFSSRKPTFEHRGVTPLRLQPSDLARVSELKVSAVVNLNRGETETDFLFHQALVACCNRNDAKYVYASSFNAVDADDPPNSRTDYGRFKGRCETELLKTCARPVAFRFSATHGWAPNRLARTEEFLQKLARGETVPTPQGLIQNRTFVDDLAKMIATLTVDQGAEGVFHLGASDFSDEIVFLRKLASAFGYDTEQVSEGEPLNWNAITIAERWQTRYPNAPLPTEMEAIARVRQQSELQKYAKL
jgi:dTDP-4-dehydrorhamnose reductase